MARAGLAVPAEAPVQLPAYSAVLADIGDEQSLSANLSTFSGHLRRIQVQTTNCSVNPTCPPSVATSDAYRHRQPLLVVCCLCPFLICWTFCWRHSARQSAMLHVLQIISTPSTVHLFIQPFDAWPPVRSGMYSQPVHPYIHQSFHLVPNSHAHLAHILSKSQIHTVLRSPLFEKCRAFNGS